MAELTHDELAVLGTTVNQGVGAVYAQVAKLLDRPVTGRQLLDFTKEPKQFFAGVDFAQFDAARAALKELAAAVPDQDAAVIQIHGQGAPFYVSLHHLRSALTDLEAHVEPFLKLCGRKKA